MSRPIGAQGNQGEVAAFLIRARLQRGQTMLHQPRRSPLILARVQRLQIVQHADHDRPRADGLQRRSDIRLADTGDFAQPFRAFAL